MEERTVDGEDDTADREAIMKRRHRFIAMALAGASLSIASCAQPCLRFAPDSGPPSDGGSDAGDEPADAGE